MRAGRTRVALAAAAVLAAGGTGGAATAHAATAPLVQHMTVFRDGRAAVRDLRVGAATVRVSGRRCAVGSGTPLAALLRARPGSIGLRDFGSCSRRAGDAGSLFVRAIGSDRNAGQSGWVYKVGNRLGTAGAGDARGPFGRGRLRSGSRVLWFYCEAPGGGRTCQSTLGAAARDEGGGTLAVAVNAYDDDGRATPAAGAVVRAGGLSAVTEPDGVARLTVGPGTYSVVAEAPGLVRSFAERIVVR